MTQAESQLRTPLYDLHLELGAKMVPFAGYSMPVSYPMGIVAEHQHTRSEAALFDVSHMGQLRISGKQAAQALESIMPVDVVDLQTMKQRYALLTNQQGGVMDDLMVTNAGDHYFVVVNAACKSQDIEHMQQQIGDRCEIEVLDNAALLALQGPRAKDVMARLAPDSSSMVFMTAANLVIGGIACFVTRSGYTGEDGFEISVAAEKAETLAKLLLEQPEVQPVGLGARDTLRLEAGLCLYGHDLDAETTPVESSLLWALSKSRRGDGVRPGGYSGAEVILKQISEGVERKRVGIKPEGRMPVREGAILLDEAGEVVGKVTSGGFGPTVNAPVAMGYVSTQYAVPQTRLYAEVRQRKIAVDVIKLPFVQQNYFRG